MAALEPSPDHRRGLARLLALEYGFHLPLYVAAAVFAYFFVTQLRRRVA